MRRLRESNIPQYAFSFEDYDKINAFGFDFTYLIDVIGYLAGVGAERTLDKDGKLVKFKVVEFELEAG
ncbi:hypothetical protein PIB30_052014 [Stylosanthes scabra]|uniref:Uncharacterized protein n=1 Tax=Stylosanthes scabra TaxID=79078 RepID=A0ABU6XGA4_9FABA|nr:hypothetical protein [Stylosanthes scabra]